MLNDHIEYHLMIKAQGIDVSIAVDGDIHDFLSSIDSILSNPVNKYKELDGFYVGIITGENPEMVRVPFQDFMMKKLISLQLTK